MSIENSTNSIIVKESRQGLFRLQWKINEFTGACFEENFTLCGSQSGRSYAISCFPKVCAGTSPSWNLTLTLKKPTPQPSNHPLQQQVIHFWQTQPDVDEIKSGEHNVTDEWTLLSFPVSRLPTTVTMWMDFGTSTVGERSLMNGLNHMFKNQISCDVQFNLVTNQRTIGAHVSILSAGSPVFAAMFQSLDQQQSPTRIVQIENTDMVVFTQLLTYLYTGSTPDLKNGDSTKSLYDAADRFGVETLKTQCIEALISNIDIDVAIQMLIWSRLRSIPALIQAANLFIMMNGRKLSYRPEWQHLKDNCPILFFEIQRYISMYNVLFEIDTLF